MLKNNKGITLPILIITVIVLLIVTGTVIANTSNYFQTKLVTDISADIKMLSEKIPVYYEQNKEEVSILNQLPISDKLNSAKSSVLYANGNTNDDPDGYYKIDLSKLPEVKLSYGYGQNGADDFYCVNSQSLVVYYIDGIEINRHKVYTTTNNSNVESVPTAVQAPEEFFISATSTTNSITVSTVTNSEVEYRFKINSIELWTPRQQGNSYTFTNLDSGKMYTVQAQAISTNGATTFSNVIKISTKFAE